MEAARYPLDQVDPSERLRLITLCHQASKYTPQWQRLYEFDQPGILDAQYSPGISNEILQRNYRLKDLVNGRLLDGMPDTDPGFAVFENLMCRQDGAYGDRITSGMAAVNVMLNTFLNNTQRQCLYEHNKMAGYSDAEKGYAFWPNAVPVDFGFDDAVRAAQTLFNRVCEPFREDRDEESVRSRLLKEAVLGDENRYWIGTASNHSEVLGNAKHFIPKNIAEIELPDSEAGVSTAVPNLFKADRKMVTKSLIEEGKILLNLYLQFAHL